MKKLLLFTSAIVFSLFLSFAICLTSYADNEESENLTEDGSDERVEEESPFLYRIYYECRGGDFDSECYIPAGFREGDEALSLPEPIKAGMYFDGWYTSKGFTKEITKVNKYSPLIVPGGTNDEGIQYIRLYAKWTPIVVDAPKIERCENLITGMIKISFDKEIAGSYDGYEIDYALSEDFTKSSHTLETDTIQSAATIRNRMENQYYLRARAYVVDMTGAKVYSDYSDVFPFYVENGITAIEPSRSAGVINSARIEGGSVVVTGEVPILVQASDDCYYVVKLDPMSEAVIGVLSSTNRDAEVSTSFSVSGNLMAKFALAVKSDDNTYELISKPTYIDNPEALASIAVHPQPASKKGRQGHYDTSAGDKHFFHNFYLDSIIASAGSHDVAYNYNGKTYYFYNPNHALNYDQYIKAANANGGTVTIQIMLRWNGASNDLITPTGRTAGYNYYALNMEESGAREKIEAAFMYLAEYWSQSGRHVDNWILGNEVNTYLNTTGRWYWAGNISHDQFMTNYSNTFRCLYYAVKSHNALGQVFTCTDHTWTNRDRDWGTMGFITALNDYLYSMNPNIVWNLANHAYTAVLTNADPWNDGSVRIYSVAHSTSASFVSPYNLEVMTNYVASHFPRTRIILSEVGFSSTGGTNPTLNGGRQAGASVQAAATAYLYYKAHFTSNIDACIFHTGDEHEAGKNFAIEYNESWNVYRYMDTPQYANYTNGYLGVIGASSWESIIPGFNGGSLASMPNR